MAAGEPAESGALRVAAPRLRRRRSSSGVPGDLFVQLFETCDELLDSVIVGHDLARGRQIAPEHATEHGIEEEHRVRTERAVRAARLQEMDRWRGEASQLDLARNALDQVVSLVGFDLAGQVHARNL